MLRIFETFDGRAVVKKIIRLGIIRQVTPTSLMAGYESIIAL